jgi:hypothetical protein
MKKVKYHKEFVEFLKDNNMYEAFRNAYELNNKLDIDYRRLPRKPMKLSEFYAAIEPTGWINNAFWWDKCATAVSGEDPFFTWHVFNTKWNNILFNLQQNEKTI